MFLTLNPEVLVELYPLLDEDIQNFINAEIEVYKRKSFVKIPREKLSDEVVTELLTETEKYLEQFKLSKNLTNQVLNKLSLGTPINQIEMLLKTNPKTRTIKDEILTFLNEKWFQYKGVDEGPETFNNNDRKISHLILTYVEKNVNILEYKLKTNLKVKTRTPRILNLAVSDLSKRDLNFEEFISRLIYAGKDNFLSLKDDIEINNKLYEDTNKQKLINIVEKYCDDVTEKNIVKLLCDILTNAPCATFNKLKENIDIDVFDFTEYLNKLYNTEYIYLAPITYQTLFQILKKEFNNMEELNHWEIFKSSVNYKLLTEICLPAIKGDDFLNEQ